MKVSHHDSLNVLVTGLLVLILFCTLLFWCRALGHRLILEPQRVHLSPSGLVSDEIEHDPNTVAKSAVSCEQTRAAVYMFLGRDQHSGDWCYDSLRPDRLKRQPRPVQISSAQTENGWLKRAWRPRTGQLVETLYAEKKGSSRYIQWDRRVTVRVGPQGFSEQATAAIGRFYEPLVIQAGGDPDAVLVYDRKLRSFFRIDFAERQIRQGPEIPSNVSISQFGDVGKNSALLETRWRPPQRLETEQERQARLKAITEMTLHGHLGDTFDANSPAGEDLGYAMMMDPLYMEMMELVMPGLGPGIDPRVMFSGETDRQDKDILRHVALVQGELSSSRGTILVLSTSGHVYELIENTLELGKPLGCFPSLKYTNSNKPRSTLAYQVRLFYREGRYAGCVVSTLSRDGTEVGVAAFDRDGLRASSHSEYRHWSEKIGGVAAMAVKSVAEALHPMGLHLLSLAWAVDDEAIRSQRALFIQSNSFVVNTLRDTDGDLISRVAAIVLWFSIPTALGLFLAWCMARDVRRLGSPGPCRTFWILAALALGPVAYITYRITRPALSLVTCVNCGRLRRVDQDQCHLCNAAWDLPELSAPAWRVV